MQLELQQQQQQQHRLGHLLIATNCSGGPPSGPSFLFFLPFSLFSASECHRVRPLIFGFYQQEQQAEQLQLIRQTLAKDLSCRCACVRAPSPSLISFTVCVCLYVCGN